MPLAKPHGYSGKNISQNLNLSRKNDAKAKAGVGQRGRRSPKRRRHRNRSAPKARQIHKAGEVNMSAYFPAKVKASLRMVHAKTGNNVKDCLAEALRDLFRKYNVPVSVDLGQGR